MPTINRIPKKKRQYTPKKLDMGKFYNAYKNIRDCYVKEHPLCQDCLNPDIVNENGEFGMYVRAVDEVHHIKPILQGKTDEEKMELATDYDNLVGLCEFHHHLRHNEGRL